ncbi:uncharacterized protein LOC111126719 [Crassostrea virginica]
MKEKSQSTDKASDAKDKDERLSHDKYQTTAGPVCKPTKSTASTSVPFWKDQKIWIQIAIVGVHLAICVYTGFSSKTDIRDLTESHLQSDLNIPPEQYFKDLFKKGWKERKETLREDLHRQMKEKLDESLRKLENQIGEIEVQMKTQKDDMTKDIDVVKSEMGNKIESVHEFLEKKQSQFDEKMKTSLHNLNQDMEIVKSKFKSVDDSLGKLETQIGGIEVQMKTHKDDMTKNIDVVKSEMKNKSKSVDDSLEKLQTQFDGINDQMETLKNDVLKAKEEVKGVDEQLEVCFKEIKDFSMYIFGVVLTIVVVGAYTYLVSRSKPFNRTIGPVHGTGIQRSSPSQSFDAKSDKQKRKELKKGLLIVSFHPSTQQFHHDALNALSEFMKTSSVKVLIQNSKDLMNVEPHKLVIIFVDFNVRNIILENEDTEIGSLRNDTTKVFLSFKCDVFVVYYTDNGSRDLPPNNLYNPRLLSIERHPVLSELKRKNRVLSIYDKFHPHQVEHLKRCCQQL